jgi:hypothetical protein
MNPKEIFAKELVKHMSDDKKRQGIQKFYDLHKKDADFELKLKLLKEMMGYQKDDVPKRD